MPLRQVDVIWAGHVHVLPTLVLLEVIVAYVIVDLVVDALQLYGLVAFRGLAGFNLDMADVPLAPGF
jgi:hypothetical protein